MRRLAVFALAFGLCVATGCGRRAVTTPKLTPRLQEVIRCVHDAIFPPPPATPSVDGPPDR